MTAQEPQGSVRERTRETLVHLQRRLERERYQVGSEIARGGMGVVYEVWDDDLHRRSAMKVCLGPTDLDELSDAELQRLQLFLTEAEITAQLDHPGIVPVHDAGVDEQGRLYFTMRLVQGKSLLAIVADTDRSRWNHGRAVRKVLLKVCEAVAFAHSRRIVHRDLKPENVMVGPFGEVYVMDWGLAVALDDPRACDGPSGGTLAYIAPEQASGQAPAPQADIYSAGAILYHLLAGEMPYERETKGDLQALLERMVSAAPQPLHEVDPDLPRELVAICEKAMERDPERRYSTMEEMIDDLHAWLDGRVVHAYESGLTAELRKWIRRHQVVVGGLVVLLSLATYSWWTVARKNDALAAEAKNSSAQSYAANLYAADASLRVFESAEAKRRLADCPEGLRQWEWHHLQRRADASVRLLTGHKDEVCGVSLHPSGERVASGSRDGTIRVWSTRSGALLHEVRLQAAVLDLAYAPDGEALAAACADGTLIVVGGDDGRTLVLHETGAQAVVAVAFDPLGRWVCAGTMDARVVVLEAPDWAERLTFGAADAGAKFFELADLDVSPDGSRLLVSPVVGTITEWDTRSGQLLRSIDVTPSRPRESLEYHPGGAALLLATSVGDVLEWDPQREAVAARYEGHAGAVKSAVYSRDGARVATAASDGTLRLWSTRSKTAQEVLLGHDRGVLCVDISADGSLIASGSKDHSVRLWDVTSSPFEYIGRDLGRVHAIDLGGQSTLAAITFQMNTARDHLRVWDLEAGALRFQRPTTAALETVLVDEAAGLVWTSLRTGGLQASNLDDGRAVREVPVEGEIVSALAHGHQPGTLILGTESGALLEVAASSGDVRLLVDRREAAISAVDVSSDGTLAAAAADGAIAIHRAGRRATTQCAGHTGAVRSIRFDGEGRRLVSASDDKTVRIWSVDDGRELSRLDGHGHRVATAAWSPDGQRIASGAADGTVRVWSAETGRALLTLRAHADLVTGVAFSADGKRLFSASNDGSIQAWR